PRSVGAVGAGAGTRGPDRRGPPPHGGRAANPAWPSGRVPCVAVLPRPHRSRDCDHARHLVGVGEDACPSWPGHTGPARGAELMSADDQDHQGLATALRQAMTDYARAIGAPPDRWDEVEARAGVARRRRMV